MTDADPGGIQHASSFKSCEPYVLYEAVMDVNHPYSMWNATPSFESGFRMYHLVNSPVLSRRTVHSCSDQALQIFHLLEHIRVPLRLSKPGLVERNFLHILLRS